MLTLPEFLKIDKNQEVALKGIVGVLRERGEWGARGLFSKVGESTGFSAAYVGQVLNGKKVLTEKFVEKMAVYLGVSVNWLRGVPWAGKHGDIDFNNIKPLAICAECGRELQVSPEGLPRTLPNGEEEEGDGIYRVYPCENCCKKEKPTSPA